MPELKRNLHFRKQIFLAKISKGTFRVVLALWCKNSKYKYVLNQKMKNLSRYIWKPLDISIIQTPYSESFDQRLFLKYKFLYTNNLNFSKSETKMYESRWPAGVAVLTGPVRGCTWTGISAPCLAVSFWAIFSLPMTLSIPLLILKRSSLAPSSSLAEFRGGVALEVALLKYLRPI